MPAPAIHPDPLASERSSIAAQQAKLDAAEAATQARTRALDRAYAETKPAPKPPVPTEQPAPAAPSPALSDTARQEINKWGLLSLALVLAGGGNAGATQSATMALAGAVEGVNEGNQQKFKNNFAIWQRDSQAVQEHNRLALLKYRTILQDNRLDFEEKMKSLDAAMREAGHDQSAQLLEQGRLNAALAHLDQLQIALGNQALNGERLSAELKRLDLEIEKAKGGAKGEYKLFRDDATGEWFRYNPADNTIEKAPIPYGAETESKAKAPATTPQEQALVPEIDALIAQVQADPSVVGPVGRIRQIWEGVAPAIGEIPGVSAVLPKGSFDVSPAAQNFQSNIAKLQAKVARALVGGGQLTRMKAAFINRIVRGTGNWDSPAAVIRSLQEMRDTLGGTVGEPAAGPLAVLEGKQASAYPDMKMTVAGRVYVSNGSEWVDVSGSK